MAASDENAPIPEELASRRTRRTSVAAEASTKQVEMSPRKLSRRMAKPRKSILKQSVLSPSRASSSPKSNVPSKRRISLSGSPSKPLRSSPSSSPAKASSSMRAAPLFRPQARGIEHAQTTDFSQLRREMEGTEQGEGGVLADGEGYEDMPGISTSQTDDQRPKSRASIATSHAHTINYSAIASISTTSQSLRASSNPPASKDKQKAERRAYLALARASRKSVSFAPHAYVRMFEKEDKDNKTPATAQGAKTMTSAEAASNAAQQSGPSSRVEGQPEVLPPTNEADKENERRSVFNFDAPVTAEQTEANLKATRRASLIAVAAERSASARSRHSRGSSITGMPSAPSPVKDDGAPAPISQRRNIFESAAAAPPVSGPAPAMEEQDEGATMDMDIESDEEQVEQQEEQAEITTLEARQQWTHNIFDTALQSVAPRWSNVFADVEAPGVIQAPESASARGSRRAETPRSRLSYGTDIGDDMSMDMDMTQVMSGGIYQESPGSTASAPASPRRAVESDDEEGETMDAEEEKTMDFTVAIGGLIPSLPPVGAWNDRNSIGYGVNLPAGHAGFEPISTIFGSEIIAPQETSSPLASRIAPQLNPFASPVDGQGAAFTLPAMPRISYGNVEAADESMEMEETMAFGGVMSQRNSRRMPTGDESMDSSVDEQPEDGMEFTVAGGGIFAGSLLNAEPLSLLPVTPTETAFPSVPSYAKPTAASERRNVFGPSPSPKRTPNGSRADQPIGRDPEVAKSVAKKLDFIGTNVSPQPGTPSGGTPKKTIPKTSLYGNAALPIIITSPYKSPRRSMANSFFPFTSVDGTPVRPTRVEGAPSPAKLSGKSPARMLFSAQPDWAQEEYSNITLANFLEMTGIQFLESMPTAGRRKSTLAGGLSQEVLARMREVDASPDLSYSLSEYSTAMVETLHFNMYQWGCTQMKNDIAASQITLDQTDKDASDDNPPVIREYLAASDEEKGFFELTIKNLKTNAHLIARDKWYGWKQSLVSQVQPMVSSVLDNIREDELRLQSLQSQVDSVLPQLHNRYAILQAELEAERLAIAEIADCDQDELKSLKADVAEQTTQIESFGVDLKDTENKLEQLGSKHLELQNTKQAHQSAISMAKKECAHQKGFSKHEVYSLQAEFSSIQHLHLWQLDQLQDFAIQMNFDGEIKLTAKWQAFRPELTTVELELLGKPGPTSQSLFDMVLGLVKMRQKQIRSFAELVQKVGQWWSSAQRVRSEIRLMTLRFPTTCSFEETFRTTATLMLPASRSKVRLMLSIPADTLATWPHNVHCIDANVQLIYGNADPRALEKIARDCLDGTTQATYLGAMLQSGLEISAA